MAKNDWLNVILILLGISLITDIINKADNKNKIYRCWRCNYVLNKGVGCCPNCGATQNWEGVK